MVRKTILLQIPRTVAQAAGRGPGTHTLGGVQRPECTDTLGVVAFWFEPADTHGVAGSMLWRLGA
jgi:hypothetical protein